MVVVKLEIPSHSEDNEIYQIILFLNQLENNVLSINMYSVNSLLIFDLIKIEM